MGEPPDGPPVVSLPERFDRRLRLGPFPSARDALKFLLYAATGALLVPFSTPYLWLAVVAGGFALSVFRPDGQGLDDRAVAFARWKFRTVGRGGTMTRPPFTRVGHGGLVGIGSGRYAAILRAGGTPVAYLPPLELARRFELFRELLRAVDSSLAFSVSSAPMRSGRVAPLPADPGHPDQPAWRGYGELVELLCRRRLVRRVYLVLVTERSGPDGVTDLEVRVSTLTDRLAGLGLAVVRLRGRGLEDAARRWGWSWERSAT
ncbi:MAG: hypothetical protein WBE40_06170 [Thermoplasmata archaeon]